MTKQTDRTCGVCDVPHFDRNNYFYGKLMTVRDFFAEQTYFNEKRWLLNRMVTGWGVVCGLDVCVRGECIAISPGLAIDCCGRELLVCDEYLERVPESDSKGGYGRSETYLICLEFEECFLEPIKPKRVCTEQEQEEFNRVRDGFCVRLVRPDLVDLDCDPETLCPLTHMRETEKSIAIDDYLCEALRKDCPSCEGHCCVVLGEVTVSFDVDKDCREITVQPCVHRKHVYTNRVLKDLFHCYHGDLPHIAGISWREVHDLQGAISWDRFVRVLEEGFTVWFDHEMDPTTINHHSFQIAIVVDDRDTGYFIKRFVPCNRISYSATDHSVKFEIDTSEPDPNKTASSSSEWFTDVVRGSSRIKSSGGSVEVSLRGGLIRAANGRYLDAEPMGFPTGNGVQGGEFLSCFSVNPR